MGKEAKLNPKQEVFCELYAGGGGNFFGNGTRAYIIAYDIDLPADIEYKYLDSEQQKKYDIASSAAVQLLRNIKVIKKCNELLDSLVEDKVVDRELAFTIMQREELSPKVSAIKEYNALKARIRQPGDKPDNPLFIQISKEIADKNGINPEPKIYSG